MTAPRTYSAQKYQFRVKASVIGETIMVLSREIGQQRTEPDRLGGVWMIAVINDTPTLASESFGNPGRKISRFAFNAHEKFRRLLDRRAEGSYDVASSQSADNVTTFGGCLVFSDSIGNDVYISISGGPPEIDEAITYAIGFKLGLTPPKCENPHIERAIAMMDRGVSSGQ